MDQWKMNEYMGKTVQPLMNPLIHALLHNRPQDPIKFITSYLRDTSEPAIHEQHAQLPTGRQFKRRKALNLRFQQKAVNDQQSDRQQLSYGEYMRAYVAVSSDPFFSHFFQESIEFVINRAEIKHVKAKQKLLPEWWASCLVLISGKLKSSSIKKVLEGPGVYLSDFLVHPSPASELMAIEDTKLLLIPITLYRATSQRQSSYHQHLVRQALITQQLTPDRAREVAASAAILANEDVLREDAGFHVVLRGLLRVYRMVDGDWVFEDQVAVGGWFGRKQGVRRATPCQAVLASIALALL